MAYRRLSESVQTLYAELLDQSIHGAAEEAARDLPLGTFISKTIKGRTYWYVQRSEGTRKRQMYLAPDSPVLREWMEDVKSVRSGLSTSMKQRRRLCAMLASGDATTEPAATIKVMKLLSDSKVFQLGGVLVGTAAFRVMSNVLGVRFDSSALKTQDLDIAQDRAIGIALSRETEPIDVEKALTESSFQFHPVPPFNLKKPSTSFRIHGRDLRVDFLTPMIGRESSEAILLPAYQVSAQPIRFLDFLLDNPIQAVVVGSDAVLVNIPDPARFAFHKLWTSRQRNVAFQAKAKKDVIQAAGLIDVLLDDREPDLASAWMGLSKRPSAQKKILGVIQNLDPHTKNRLEPILENPSRY